MSYHPKAIPYPLGSSEASASLILIEKTLGLEEPDQRQGSISTTNHTLNPTPPWFEDVEEDGRWRGRERVNSTFITFPSLLSVTLSSFSGRTVSILGRIYVWKFERRQTGKKGELSEDFRDYNLQT